MNKLKKILSIKYSLTLLTMLFIFPTEVYSQLQSINLFSDYSVGGTKRLAVTKANAVGGGVGVYFKLSDYLTIGVVGGYQMFSINQDSALTQWNWNFWNVRYRGSVQADLADSALKLSATFNPIQKMDFIPVMLTVKSNFNIFDNFSAAPVIGGGIIFYTRRLYLEEDWQRRFDQIDYTFSYRYRNFTDDKTGNPFFIMGGLNLTYQLSEIVSISTDFNYNYIIKTEGKYGYDQLPFSNSYGIKLGLNFLY